jgi:ATP-dependent DNA helicase RecG
LNSSPHLSREQAFDKGVYHQSAGLIDWVNQILIHQSPNFMPDDVLSAINFMRDDHTFKSISPETSSQAKALERFKYEEFFLFELSMAKSRISRYPDRRVLLLKPGVLTKKVFQRNSPVSS